VIRPGPERGGPEYPRRDGGEPDIVTSSENEDMEILIIECEDAKLHT
jgi:hypothetical protein